MTADGLALVRLGTRRLYYITAAAWLHYLVGPILLGSIVALLR